MICCILLSGGFSKRFRENSQGVSDKALYRINGEPMILHTYNRLREFCGPENIILSIRNEEQIKSYTAYIHEEIIYALDEVEGGGPLIALYSSLKYCKGKYVLVLPNDTPFISIDILRELIQVVSQDYDIASPMLPNSYVESLVIIAQKDILINTLRLLVKRYSRRKASDLHRSLPRVYLFNIEKHGYSYKELVNVNREHDLFRHRLPTNLIDDDIVLDREFSLLDVKSYNLAKLDTSLWMGLLNKDFCGEYLYYMRKKIYYLAMQVIKDLLLDKKQYSESVDLMEQLFWIGS
ncbi:MAG: molybdenum cofactor guanylyltransferase [Sulfolobales archaeon]